MLSAHRTPLEMVAFAQQARTRGFKVIVAGAGGAAHLPGMVASLTTLPVIGVMALFQGTNFAEANLSNTTRDEVIGWIMGKK